MKLMAVNPEELFRKGTDTVCRDSMAECSSVNENVSADLPAEPHHMPHRSSIFSHHHKAKFEF